MERAAGHLGRAGPASDRRRQGNVDRHRSRGMDRRGQSQGAQVRRGQAGAPSIAGLVVLVRRPVHAPRQGAETVGRLSRIAAGRCIDDQGCRLSRRNQGCQAELAGLGRRQFGGVVHVARRAVGNRDRTGVGVGLDRAGPDGPGAGQDHPGGHAGWRTLGDRNPDASPGDRVGDALQDEAGAGLAAPAQLAVERLGADDPSAIVSHAVEAGCERQGRSGRAGQAKAGTVDDAIQPGGLGHRTAVGEAGIEVQASFERAQLHVALGPHAIERPGDVDGGRLQRQRRSGVRHHGVADHPRVGDVVIIGRRLIQRPTHAEGDVALA